MKMIDNDIKNNTFKPAYLFYGEEGYLVSLYKKKLIKAITGDNTFNLTIMEDKPDMHELYSLSETLPFMADKRLIVLDRCNVFRLGEEVSKGFAKFLKNIPEYLCLLIIEVSVDKRKKVYTAVNEVGYTCEFGTQSEANVTAFITDRCKAEGIQIEKPVAHEIYVRTGGDLGIITGELEKLFSYTLGRDVITIDDVKAICSVRVEARVFDMIDAIAYRDKRKTYTLYFDLLAVKEPAMKILMLMESHFKGLLQVSESPKMPVGELAKTIGMKGVAPFVAGRYLKQVKAFTSERLRQITEMFADTEEDIKTGRMTDKTGVELMIAEALL